MAHLLSGPSRHPVPSRRESPSSSCRVEDHEALAGPPPPGWVPPPPPLGRSLRRVYQWSRALRRATSATTTSPYDDIAAGRGSCSRLANLFERAGSARRLRARRAITACSTSTTPRAQALYSISEIWRRRNDPQEIVTLAPPTVDTGARGCRPRNLVRSSASSARLTSRRVGVGRTTRNRRVPPPSSASIRATSRPGREREPARAETLGRGHRL